MFIRGKVSGDTDCGFLLSLTTRGSQIFAQTRDVIRAFCSGEDASGQAFTFVFSQREC